MFWTYILRQCIGCRFLWFPPLIYTRSTLSLGFVLGSLLLLFSSLASAEQVTLAWDDPNNNSAQVGGYRLYYWQPTWEMPTSVEVGLQTTYTLTNLEAGQTYWGTPSRPQGYVRCERASHSSDAKPAYEGLASTHGQYS